MPKVQSPPQLNAKLNSLPIFGSLVITFLMVIITLGSAIMPWVWGLSAFTVCFAMYRIKMQRRGIRTFALNLLAVFCLLLLVYFSSGYALVSTMVNLLVVAACLKLINLHTRADYHLLLIVLFFLIACGFTFHQSIYLVAYYFACLVLLFCNAFMLNNSQLSVPVSVQQSGKMVLQALPITIALFVIVPRLPPFWQHEVASNTQTGLSEQITPGDIANLAQSDDLVFRAEFDHTVPMPEQRYWRSIVLDYFDGKTWSINNKYSNFSVDTASPNLANANFNNSLRYLVIAEANNTRWLYSLDVPQVEQDVSQHNVLVNSRYQLFQSRPNKDASMYIVRSFIDMPLSKYNAYNDDQRYLQAPTDTNLRTQQWITENIRDDMSFAQKIRLINKFFVSQDFSYTLKPPLMQNSPVDQFLFDYQQGFCSHYASAMTYMLRLAGVPARMVAGYQGGEEKGDKILSIHQYDAHAWVEAYDPHTGWQRFDPTALIAPNRLVEGMLSALNQQESESLEGEFSALFDFAILSDLKDALDVLDYNWDQFFLEFSNDDQIGLIEQLFGELTAKTLVTFLLISIAIIILFLAILFLPYKKWLSRETKSPLDKVISLLKKHGAKRKKHESLQQFHARIANTIDPRMNMLFAQFISYYYQGKYADGKNSSKALNDVYKQMANLKP